MEPAWKQQLSSYESSGRAKDKSDEDKIARRALNALGYSNATKGISKFEEEFCGGADNTKPLWERTLKALQMTRRRNHGSTIDVLALANCSDKELMRRLETSMARGTTTYYVVLRDNIAKVYWVLLGDEYPEPPFKALKGPAQHVVIEMEASHFIKTEICGQYAY